MTEIFPAYRSGITIPDGAPSVICGAQLTARVVDQSYRYNSACWRFGVVTMTIVCTTCGERTVLLCAVCAGVVRDTVEDPEGQEEVFPAYCLDLEPPHRITGVTDTRRAVV